MFSESVGSAVECKPPASDSVGVAADDCSEVRRIAKVSAELVVAEYDVSEPSRAIGCPDRSDDPAVIGDLHLNSTGIPEGEQLGGLAGCDLPKWRGLRWCLQSRSAGV